MLCDVGASTDWPNGMRKTVQAGSRAIAVVRVEGQVYAVDDSCPHRGGSMGHGDLSGHHLYCPLHAWCFDVRTGEAFFPKGAKLQRFVVVEKDGRVWVET
jgi:nitrite reductase (NADH) small subunit